jgi:hypothetical protein
VGTAKMMRDQDEQSTVAQLISDSIKFQIGKKILSSGWFYTI